MLTLLEKNETSLNKSHYSPEQEASFFSKMFFTWLNPTLNVGYYRPLSVTDLPQLNTDDEWLLSLLLSFLFLTSNFTFNLIFVALSLKKISKLIG